MSTARLGISDEEARARLARVGPNRLFTPAPVRFWAIAWEEIREPMILLLLAVGVFYGLWGSLADALTIFAIIVLLVAAEVVNEFRAKRAIGALQRLSAPKARVRRGGRALTVDVEEVVPGDVLILVPGERIPADATLATAIDVGVDESALTGESAAVEKSVGDAVYAGTVVVTGEGDAEATATGAVTRLGRMAGQLGDVKPPKTPLQLAMKALSAKLVWVALLFSIAIPLIGIARGGAVRPMILTGLALAFAVIPEEMPIIVTMVLGLGSYRLSRRNFLVKRLRAAETLGNATVLLTDKTGTLTEGRMQVAAAWPAQSERAVLEAALGTVSPGAPDSLEQAVLERAGALGVTRPAGGMIGLRHLGSGRRSKAVLWRLPDGAARCDLTGAPEEVFARCREVPEALRAALAQEAAKGRRVVAVATRAIEPARADRPLAELERGLDLVGLLALADPPRAGVKETVAQVAAAGIRTVMVTGDHHATATAIAREVAIPADRVLTGDELDRLDDATLSSAVREVSVFARTTPEHKLRLVEALQRNGEVVVVTGDGVNDALALKAADVGVAMGLRGTDVAREAAQAVLGDDSYATLACGVFEGRRFSDNLRKGVNYYLAVKVALVAVFLVPVVFGLPLPFSPIQIILLEMFMDLAASAGFVAEPAEHDVTRRAPRRTVVVDGPALRALLLKGVLLFAAVMSAYGWATWRGLPIEAVQTIAFGAWIVGHVALAFVSRSDHESLARLGLFSNRVMGVWALAAVAFLLLAVYLPPLREVLRFAEVAPGDLGMAALLGLLWAGLAELGKIPSRSAGGAAKESPPLRPDPAPAAGHRSSAREVSS